MSLCSNLQFEMWSDNKHVTTQYQAQWCHVTVMQTQHANALSSTLFARQCLISLGCSIVSKRQKVPCQVTNMQSRVDSPKNVKYTRVTKVYSRNQKNLPACKARAQHMAKHDTADQVGMPLLTRWAKLLQYTVKLTGRAQARTCQGEGAEHCTSNNVSSNKKKGCIHASWKCEVSGVIIQAWCERADLHRLETSTSSRQPAQTWYSAQWCTESLHNPAVKENNVAPYASSKQHT